MLTIVKDYFQSLTFEGLSDRRRTISRNTIGTCDWMLRASEYRCWIQQNGLLLIRGQPGCGKSTLTKYMLTKQSGRDSGGTLNLLAISFFFHTSGMILQNSIQGMFRSLIHQLLDGDIESRPLFHELCLEIFSDGPKTSIDIPWNQQDLMIVFEKLTERCAARRTIRIFIDAVDECRTEDHAELIQFFHSFRESNRERAARIGVFMTSRIHPDGQIVPDFQIRLEERSQGDIQKYIKMELRLPDETERARNELQALLHAQANGSFLWLVLVMRRVHELNSKGVSLKVIRSDVQKCPQQLNLLYENLLDEIAAEDIPEVGTLFQWICFAARPLTADELRTAFTIGLTGVKTSVGEYLNEENANYTLNQQKLRKRIIYLSRGLVDFSSTALINGETLVRFCHDSFRDFMLTKGLETVSCRMANVRNLAETAHTELANACQRFLSCNEVTSAMADGDLDYLRQHSFFKYAQDYWVLHAAEADNGDMGCALDRMSHTTLAAWIRVNLGTEKSTSSFITEGSQPVHVAARYGLVSLVKKLISDYRGTKEQLTSKIETKPGGRLQVTVSRPHTRSRPRVLKRDINVPNGSRKERQARPERLKSVPSIEKSAIATNARAFEPSGAGRL